MVSRNTSSNQDGGINPYVMEKMKTMKGNIAKMKAKGLNTCRMQEKYDLMEKDIYAELCELDEPDDCQVENITSLNAHKPRTYGDMMILAKEAGAKQGSRQITDPKSKSKNTVTIADFLKKQNNDQGQKTKQAKTNQRQQNGATSASNRVIMVSEHTHQRDVGQQSQEVQQSQQEKSASHKENQQKKKSYCAPRSMSRFLKMRKKSDLSGQGTSNIPDMQQHDDSHVPNDEMGFTDDDDELSDVAENETNEVSTDPANVLNENAVVTGKKRHRGRTVLPDIYARTMEERDVLVLNDMRQVVGPTKKIVRKFGHFLGTVARNHKLAPLNILDWHRMPTKDQIWEFIQTKYMVPEEGKKWVLSSVGKKWRERKVELKKFHFSKDATLEEMLANSPKDVPKSQFKELLLFWSTPAAKDTSERNKDNRAQQKDMHTLGPTSIAMLRHEMQQNDPEKRCPTQADLYIASRERTDGRTYITENDETMQNIAQMKALQSQSLDEGNAKSDVYHDVITKKEHNGRLRMFGHGVTKSTLKTKDPKNPFILPQVFLEPISQQLEKKLEDMEKRQ